jgi:hypothetical protein
MATENEPTLHLAPAEPDSPGPIAVRVERDGTGSASFDWQPVLQALTRGLEDLVRRTLGHEVCVVGLRFIDSDGRAINGPVPAGITLVGFTTAR